MPVFISHRTADDDLAEKIKNRLTNIHDIECWIDGIGPSSPTETITKEVLAGINRCTHLIAVVTEKTGGSWWVPYEIGVAQQGRRAITSYSSFDRHLLPEYLWQWPIIRGDNAVDAFARYYKTENIIVETVDNFSRSGKIASSSKYGNASAADTFHRKLKAALGQ
jgi:hypothetical protein